MSDWDVSSVTDMQSAFESWNSFNGDISKWDTSRVTAMTEAFYSAFQFNADLSKWDVSNVNNMQSSKFFLSCLRCCRIADSASYIIVAFLFPHHGIAAWLPVQRL